MIKKIAELFKRSLFRHTVTTTILSTLGRAAGFLVPFFIAAWFGLGEKMDAFFFAYGFVLLILSLIASTVKTVIVPFIAEARSRGEDIGKFVGNILVVASVSIAVLFGGMLVLIKSLFNLITDFSRENINFTFLITVELFPLALFLNWTNVLEGTLNAYKKFAIPALSPAVRASVNILLIFLLKERFGIHSIVIGYISGEFLRLLILLSSIFIQKIFSFSFSLALTKKLKEFIKKAFTQVLGMAILSLNPFVDKAFASWLGEGGISVLYYADKLNTIPITFFTSGLLVTLLSHWSDRFYKISEGKLKQDVNKALKTTLFIILPLEVLLIVFYRQVVSLAFGRGSVRTSDLTEISRVYLFYLLGFVPYILARIYNTGHIVLKNIKAILICAIIMNICNIIFNFILMHYLGLAGLALSTSLVNTAGFLFLMIIFYTKVRKIEKQQS